MASSNDQHGGMILMYHSLEKGCWDGDGTVCTRVTNGGNVLLRTGFVNINKHFVNYLKSYLETEVGLTPHKLYHQRNVYSLDYGHRDSLKLMGHLYTDANLYMDRKYNKYMELSTQ